MSETTVEELLRVWRKILDEIEDAKEEGFPSESADWTEELQENEVPFPDGPDGSLYWVRGFDGYIESDVSGLAIFEAASKELHEAKLDPAEGFCICSDRQVFPVDRLYECTPVTVVPTEMLDAMLDSIVDLDTSDVYSTTNEIIRWKLHRKEEGERS